MKYKVSITLFLLFFLLIFLSSAPNYSSVKSSRSAYKLVWTENFNSSQLDTTVWTRIRRGSGDWDRHMSFSEDLCEIKNGKLILWGKMNDYIPNDTSRYVTGGVWTYHKKGFKNGRLEIRAKVPNAQGAWPAIWLMPNETTYNWPYKGEIDIMEHYYHDRFVLQTLHSGYIDIQGNQNKPKFQVKPRIKNNSWNIYAVDFDTEVIRLYVNGRLTLEYPNLTDLYGEDQFPYGREQHLILSMQMYARWAGNVDPKEFPAKMEIDWVKFYEKVE